MSLVVEFQWEGTGENRENIKDRERPDGDSLEPKKQNMSWTQALAVKTY